MSVVNVLVGLPGSGKSTTAKEMLMEHAPGETVRINRDNIRTAMFGAEYHKGNFPSKDEAQVTAVQVGLIEEALQKGKSIIDDNTNLGMRTVQDLVALANKHGAEVRFNYFDVPVEECKRRNRLRGDAGGRYVGEHIIDQMAARSYDHEGKLKEYLIGSNGSISSVSKNTRGSRNIKAFNAEAVKQYPLTGKAVVIVDLDGTLANNSRDLDEAFGVPGEKRNFHKFHKASEHAPVNENVLRLIKDMRSDSLNIIALSGRTDSYARETINFLNRIGAPVSRLILKREGDFRPDTDFKLEALSQLQDEGLVVVHAIDDRPRVLEMWENAGIALSVVPYHEPVNPATGPQSYDAPEVQTVFGTGTCIRCGQALKNGGNIGPKCRTKL